MMRLIARLLTWWDDFQDRRRIHQIARYWHKQGAIAPYAAAEEERYLRLKLEEFRNFASRRYMDNRTVTRVEIKQEWLDMVVKPMARHPDTQEAAKALKAAVVLMGDEMFVGEARRLRNVDVSRLVAEAGSHLDIRRRRMRDNALRI